MAIKYLAGHRIEGLAADTKPTTAEDGSIFTETDTGNSFKITAGVWTAFGPTISGVTGETVYSYIIFKSGINYIAYNTITKANQFSNTTAETTFNSVITAMNTAGGGLAFVKNAIYPIGAALIMKHFTGLVGEDMEKTILRCITNAVDSTVFRYWAGLSSTLLEHFIIKNLKIEINNLNGNGTGPTEASLISSGSKNCEVDHVWVKSFSTPSTPKIGMFWDTANNTNNNEKLIVKNCRFEGTCGGQDMLGCGMLVDCDFSENEFRDLTSQAIGIGSTTRSVIQRNRFINTGNAIGYESTCTDNLIADNILYNTTGIKLSEEGGALINISRNNKCIDNLIMYGWGGIEAGISISDEITGNKIYRTERNGIRGAFHGCNVSFNHLVDTNFGNFSQTVNGAGKTLGGIIMLNYVAALPDSDDNILEHNIMQDTGLAFTDPVSTLSKSGNVGGIVVDTNYDQTKIMWNTYIDLPVQDVFDFGTNTTRIDIDNSRNINLLSNQHIKVRGNNGIPFTFLNFNGQVSPSQTMHFFPDYIKQVGATTVELQFGYNSDLTDVNFNSKWINAANPGGTNKEYFKIDANNNLLRFRGASFFFGDNQRLKIVETGLTTERQFTFPDTAGVVLTDTAIQTISNKSIQGLDINLASKTATYTATMADDIIPCAPAADMIINLPAVATAGITGKLYTIQKTNSNAFTVTIEPSGAETLNGAANMVLTTQYQSVTIYCDGAAWFSTPFSTERRGLSTATGNGSTATFNVPHGLGVVPHDVVIMCSNQMIMFTYTLTTTNIVVTFDTPPANASAISFHWTAVI